MNEPIHFDGDSLATVLEKLNALLGRASPPQRFMSIKTAATYSDLSPDSIRRLLERGDLTPHRPVRGKILIDRQQLDQVILGSTTAPRNGRGTAVRIRGSDGCYRGNGNKGSNQ